MKNVSLSLIFIPVAFCLIACTNNQTGTAALPANGVIVYDSSKTEAGLTLIDDDLYQSFLVDMSGNLVKRFPVGLANILPNGNIIGRLDSYLLKIDSNMNIIWKRDVNLNIHHAITTDSTGCIYLLSSDAHDFMGLKVRFDVINIFSPDGKLIYKWCVYDHLGEFVSIISKSTWLKHLPISYDLTKDVEEYVQQQTQAFITPTIKHYPSNPHFNFEFTRFTSIEVLQENSVSKINPAFKKGNLLLSFNPYSCYGILDTHTDSIVWVGYLPERSTLHSPTLTSDGTILVFQNSTDSTDWTVENEYDSLRTHFFKSNSYKALSKKPTARLWTSITEYNPLSNSKIWEYTAKPKESLQASNMGSAQRLSNGNTLVCITTKEQGGRVFELTPDKRIAWSYSFPENTSKENCSINFFRAKRISSKMTY